MTSNLALMWLYVYEHTFLRNLTCVSAFKLLESLKISLLSKNTYFFSRIEEALFIQSQTFAISDERSVFF